MGYGYNPLPPIKKFKALPHYSKSEILILHEAVYCDNQGDSHLMIFTDFTGSSEVRAGYWSMTYTVTIGTPITGWF